MLAGMSLCGSGAERGFTSVVSRWALVLLPHATIGCFARYSCLCMLLTQVPIVDAILALQEARQGSLADVAAPPLGWQLVPGSSALGDTRLFSSDGRLGLPGTLHRWAPWVCNLMG